MKQKIWHVAERLAEDVFEHLLLHRKLESPEQQQSFFNPSLADLSPPTTFQNIDMAVDRIVQAIEAKQPMVVWGDFDADGVTSTAILWETLHQLGAEVMPYIPSRDAEGHGFSEVGIQRLVDGGVKLVITVDHGVAAIEEVERIKAKGIDVIITDHHEPRLAEARRETGNGMRNAEREKGDPIASLQDDGSLQSSNPAIRQSDKYVLPQADAVIHPLLMKTPQPLAGCGVAYQLAYAVWLKKRRVTGDGGRELVGQSIDSLDTPEARLEFAKNKIELAGIGTIADMVPLLGDNRVLAAFGLRALLQTQRPGLKQMYKLAGLADKKSFGTYDVGFMIGPRLNAPGRLADALESLRLLCVKSAGKASELAQDLDDLNKHRQDLLMQVANEAKAEVLKHEDGVFVMAKPNWPAGVCGLAAGKIVEMYHRPTVVMEEMGELSRGSARSIKGFDFTAALTQISDLLESFGGHAMAAGFVAKTTMLPEIEQKLSELLWRQFKPEELVPQLHIDAEVSTEMLDWDFYHKLQQFEPCGMGNPKPVFVLRNMQVVNYRVVGGDGKHLKLTLRVGDRRSEIGDRGEGQKRQEDTGTDEILNQVQDDGSLQSSNPAIQQSIDGIAFNLGYWADKLDVDSEIDVAFTLDENVWNGKRSLQLMVKDIRLSGA